jgi:bifunctional non-homologous end joining protein LigD
VIREAVGGRVSETFPDWLPPAIVVEVAFIEWTVHGKLRHPRVTGLRVDGPARPIVPEDP